jgi:glycosyltransferase involved in cell wall biosynthesis
MPSTPVRPLRVATVIARLEGGAGQLALRGAELVSRGAVTVTIIAGSGQRLIEDAASAGLEVIVEPRLRAPIALVDDLLALRHTQELFAERQFDVVHTHGAKGGAIGRLAAHRTGLAHIVHTYHGFPFHQFQSRPRQRAYVSIERRLGRYTDIALCVGTGVAAEAARRRLVAPDRIRTIGVVVDSQAAAAARMSATRPQARQRARDALALPANATVVGVVGRLTYQKAPEDFLAAIRMVGRPGLIGVWIGGGELATRIERKARRLPQATVMLAGERADVLDILPALDIFVLPSRYEGLPTAIVEAMICGVPVIATAVNAVPDLVIPGETGLLVPPARPDVLAAAIRHLLDSPSLARALAAKAAARVGGRYDEQTLCDTLTAAYAAPHVAQTARPAASY